MTFGQVLSRRALAALLVAVRCSRGPRPDHGKHRRQDHRFLRRSASRRDCRGYEPESPGYADERHATDGSYRFPAVPPGGYVLKAHLDGFRPAEKAATVSLDATATVDMVLQLAAAEQVVVSGQAPLMDTTSTTTGTNYTSSVIAQLPVDRNYADIVRANPGVDTDRGDTQGRSLALTIYGATSAENQWIIDGVNTTNVYKGIQGKAINNEFVQEVEVKTGGYQAEYGPGARGRHQRRHQVRRKRLPRRRLRLLRLDGDHGAAASSSRETPPSREMRVVDGERFDYGFDLGGFIVKDRLWIFGAYNRVESSGPRVAGGVVDLCLERRTGSRSTRRATSIPES